MEFVMRHGSLWWRCAVAQSQLREIEILVRARYPILYIVSWEEPRVDEALAMVAQARNKKLFVWTLTRGLRPYGAARGDDDSRDPMVALDRIAEEREAALFALKDFHPFLGDATVIRKLRDLTVALKTTYKTLILISPLLRLPTELEKEVTVLDFALPSPEELGRLLDAVIQSVKNNPQVDADLTEEERSKLIKAAQGLTLLEAENVFARSLVEHKRFDLNTILSEKEQIIRKTQILEYSRAAEGVEDIGGLEILKNWLVKRSRAFTDEARAYGLPEPKGLLLLGVQGCGKSLTAKTVANLWRLPLLKMDVGKVFSGLVGSSEENIRRAIRISESVAPAVLWIDEIEKGFSGTQSSGISDAGTTARVFASFITWLQEKESPVFVIATANDISELPPELMRKGRFDDIFFVDLPGQAARREIFRIHLTKRNRDPSKFDSERLAAITPGFSGAEIEQAIISAMYEAFDAGREVGLEDVEKAIEESFPLSTTMREDIEFLRDWAAHRARPASAETPEEQVAD